MSDPKTVYDKPVPAFDPAIASVQSSSPPAAGSVDEAFDNLIRKNASTQAPPSTAIEALNKWEQACYRAIGRYRNWLTHNMILFLADYLNSPQGSSGIEKIRGGFAEHFAEHALGNLASHTVVKIGEETGGHLIAKLFLEKGAAKVLGGVVGFVIEVVVEAVIGDLVNKAKAKEIVGYTAAQVDALVTGVVNPIADRRLGEVTKAMQDLRDDLAKDSPSAEQWSLIKADAIIATFEVDGVLLDEHDEHLYRQMALMADVYSRTSVPAEDASPVTLSGAGDDIGFTMQHAEVKTGQTSINVLGDGGTVVVRLRAYDCVEFDDGFSPVDINGPDASPSWKTPPPPREYDVRLYQTGTLSDSNVGVPRVYHVGKEEYGVWYNLPIGVYHVMAERGDDHIVALGAEGKYWLNTDL